jgi:hypothetical protein
MRLCASKSSSLMVLPVVIVDPFINYLLFADDLKICCIMNVENCKVFQCNNKYAKMSR